MDLRQKKTLRAIQNAFYTLLQQKKLEAITVTELCKQAEISKATFYLHYRDIFDLSEKMQNDVIRTVFSRLENPMEVLTNTTGFMQTFLHSFEQESERILLLFSNHQAGVLPVRILQYLKSYIFVHAPELRDDPKLQVFLNYHIMGGYYACMESGNNIGYQEAMKILEEIQIWYPEYRAP